MQAIIEDQLKQLKAEGNRHGRYYDVEWALIANGTTLVRLKMQLPAGWNQKVADICFLIPVGYPVAKPSTSFWTQENLRLEHGAAPLYTKEQHAHGIPSGMIWWAQHSTAWLPNHDNLVTVVEAIRRRFTHLV